ncbi:MAG: discoidin domain-containing protein [Ignavibacteriae bacterium]|nr:discoidin domain-containing protein [Ignavibacteriota bacterium]
MKIDHKGIGAKVTFENEYSKKYSGGNHNALFDGWTSPDTMISIVDYSVLQGFQKNDLVATVDFGKTIEMEKISIGFLQYLESWIFLPEFVEIQFSNDKKNFKDLRKINRTSSINSTIIFKENFNFSFQPITARYLKIHAKSIGNCPSWHQGAGEPAWVFADEVIVN